MVRALFDVTALHIVMVKETTWKLILKAAFLFGHGHWSIFVCPILSVTSLDHGPVLYFAWYYFSVRLQT